MSYDEIEIDPTISSHRLKMHRRDPDAVWRYTGSADAADLPLDRLVAAWPDAIDYGMGGDGRIWFSCPACDAPAFYQPETGRLSCRMECDPSQVAVSLRTNHPEHRARVEEIKERTRAREQAEAELAEEQAAEHAAAWFGITGDEVDLSEPEQGARVLKYGEGRYAFAPGVKILFGKRGTLKSWIELEAVRQELGKGNLALMIDYEMTKEKVVRRLVTLGATPEELSRFVYVEGGPISDAARAHLLRRFADEPPSLVVLDSVGLSMSVAGFSTNDDSETGEWYMAVPKWLSRQWPDAVILLIDHTPKGDGSARDPIGSQRKGAFADGLYSVEVKAPISKTRRGNGTVTLTKDRDGDGEEGEPLFAFEFGGGGSFVLSLPTPPDPKAVPADMSAAGVSDEDAARMARIADYVGANEPVTVKQAWTDLDMRSEVFTPLKTALVRLGVLVHPERKGLGRGPGWGDRESLIRSTLG